MIVPRSLWGARSPKNTPGRLAAPTGVTYHWGGPPVGVRSHADCPRKVRAWQAFHMDVRGWADIAYNLIVCPHGSVYEGRGVHARSAANGTNVGNTSHYAICYLGGEGEPLTEDGKHGLLDARDYLMEHGNAGREVRTHNSWKSTGCPGPHLEQWIAGGCQIIEPEEEDDMPLSQDDVERIAQRTRQVVADGQQPYGLDNLRRMLVTLLGIATRAADGHAITRAELDKALADLPADVVNEIRERLA